MRENLWAIGRQSLVDGRGEVFIIAQRFRRKCMSKSTPLAQKCRRRRPRSLPWLPYSSSARWFALPDVRWREISLRSRRADSERKTRFDHSLYGKAGEAREGKSAREHMMNIIPRDFAEGLGLGDALASISQMLREVFSQNRASSRVLQTDGEHSKSRALLFLSAAHAAKDSGIALKTCREDRSRSTPRPCDKKHTIKCWRSGRGELDKSGMQS